MSCSGQTKTIISLDDVLRHEVGHAIAAHTLGYGLRFIVFGMGPSGWPFGWAKYAPADDDDEIRIKSAGTLALYLKDVSGEPSQASFVEWFWQNQIRAAGGVTDWNDILSIAKKPRVRTPADYLEFAILPYFDDAIEVLAQVREKIDCLTEFVRHREPGVGPRMLCKYFTAKKVTRWDWLFDRPVVNGARRTEMRRHSTTGD
jgi:hypothetical protein